MPIIFLEPWCAQFFQHIKCPEDVTIPTLDEHAWVLFTEHNWIYNKLSIALSQGLDAAPHGVMPKSFPVFSKPIMNLEGMGTGSCAIPDKMTYMNSLQPGHFWSPLLVGRHLSTDAAIVNGEIVWCRHTTGVATKEGMFDYWHIHKEAEPKVERWCSEWSRKHLAGYTGMVNFETIGGRIIEAHLRFADQWPDLYGEGWMDAVVRLYSEKRWVFDDSMRCDQYSVILWGEHGRSYRHPPAERVAEAKAVDGVVSVQITFYEDWNPSMHPNPPGGFRLAIVNASDLEAGREAVEILRKAIV
ncbi:MAG: hypothetical protein J3Q66DRAFT_285710 [Benniella sp.]|nr:MAG: hypothetical protein J3Q66DRAFT_285710 [Benniella sp.]